MIRASIIRSFNTMSNDHDRKRSDDEPSDRGGEGIVNFKGIALFLALFTATGILIHFGLAGLLLAFRKHDAQEDRRFAARQTDSSIKRSQVQFPEPRLQLAPREDLAALRTREDAELNSYGWVDKTSGVVRIPIDRAMDLVLERGLPVRGTNDTPRRISPLQLQRERAEQR